MSATAIFDLVNNCFLFEQQEFHSVVVNGEVWFRAKDITQFLCYKDTAKAIVAHVAVENVILLSSLLSYGVLRDHFSFTSDQLRSKYINEVGFYSLVFRSNKPIARSFAEYVAKDILPGIRKQQQERYRAQLVEKDDTISTLKRELAEFRRETRQSFGEQQEEITELKNTTNYILDTLAEVSDRSVIEPQDEQLQEVAMLVRFDPNPNIGQFTHGVIRTQRRGVENALSRKRKEHPQLEIVSKVDPAPNSRRLLHALKENITEEAYFKGNSIDLFDMQQESLLVDEFQRAHQKRLEQAEECAKRARHN